MTLVNFIFFWLILLSAMFVKPMDSGNIPSVSEGEETVSGMKLDTLYHKLNLEKELDVEVLHRALSGYEKLTLENKKYITIVDFSQVSTEDRLFIIDLENQKIIYQTYVAHGKNSGLNVVNKVSNISKSLQSSPGFYITGETYYGKHGYSLRLDGMETGINDNARMRAIVMHGADYVSKQFINQHHRLGRSWGCPAIPNEISKEIINLIKNGSCLYIHIDDPVYLEQSEF